MFAGDLFTGTEWFTQFGIELSVKFLNILAPDVITIGNHEFDKGLDGLEEYVKSVKCPVVLANAEFKKNIGIKKSVTFTVKDRKIGVIGAITYDMMNKSKMAADVVFKDEIISINAEAENLKRQGVEIIIALTHSGYAVDKKIAKDCPLVDVVVGGHTHSFLTSSKHDPIHPELLNIEGPYPTSITQPTGKVVPVVQAYCYSKYLGRLDLTVIIIHTRKKKKQCG